MRNFGVKILSLDWKFCLWSENFVFGLWQRSLGTAGTKVSLGIHQQRRLQTEFSKCISSLSYSCICTYASLTNSKRGVACNSFQWMDFKKDGILPKSQLETWKALKSSTARKINSNPNPLGCHNLPCKHWDEKTRKIKTTLKLFMFGDFCQTNLYHLQTKPNPLGCHNLSCKHWDEKNKKYWEQAHKAR